MVVVVVKERKEEEEAVAISGDACLQRLQH
jgi:hypothetical protein